MTEYSQFVRDYAKPLPTFHENVGHSFIGMLGELGELADAWKKHELYEQPLNLPNILEELGDFDFYFQLGVNQFKYEDSQIFETYPCADTYIKDTFANMAQYIGKFYDWRSDKFVPLECLRTINYCIESLCVHFNFTREQVRTYNMEKLRKRYPEKYTNEHAKLRLDKEHD